MAEGNGYDRQSWHDLFAKVTRVDEKVTRLDEGISGMREDLGTIAQNTGVAAEYYKQVGTSNITLSELAAGKKQVSMSAFLLIIFLFGAFAIVVVIRESKLNVRLSMSGFEITQGGMLSDAGK